MTENAAPDPGYIAGYVHPGDHLTVTLPDGSTHDVVVLDEYKSGSVRIDFRDRLADRLALHEAALAATSQPVERSWPETLADDPG